MTEIQKAIKFAECEIKSLELAPEINGCEMTEVWKEQIQIWKTVISALEKQIPKKVEKIKSGFKSFNYVCPECAYRQISQIDGEWIAGQHYNYCSNCGQTLDWSDTNDR